MFIKVLSPLPKCQVAKCWPDVFARKLAEQAFGISARSEGVDVTAEIQKQINLLLGMDGLGGTISAVFQQQQLDNLRPLKYEKGKLIPQSFDSLLQLLHLRECWGAALCAGIPLPSHLKFLNGPDDMSYWKMIYQLDSLGILVEVQEKYPDYSRSVIVNPLVPNMMPEGMLSTAREGLQYGLSIDCDAAGLLEFFQVLKKEPAN